ILYHLYNQSQPPCPFFFLMLRRLTRSALFPYTTLFRSLLGGDGWDSAKLFEIGGDALQGSFFSNHYSLEDPSPRIRGEGSSRERSEEHTSELQSRENLVCRLLLEKKKKPQKTYQFK